MNVGALLLALALIVSWACIVLPRRHQSKSKKALA